MNAEVRDVAPGLWIWRRDYPDRRPAMRAMLDLPFEPVIVSHVEPVHDRAAFERALEGPQWTK